MKYDKLTINIRGRIIELLHKNGKMITFSIDCPLDEVKKNLNSFPLKARLKHFNKYGTMKDY